MAYSPTNWGAGQSITADLMNKIEQGIKNAANDSSEAKSTAQGASQTVNGFQATLTDHDGRLEDLENAAETNDTRIQQGVDAWAQVKPTLTYSGNNITKTLKKRLEDDEDIVDKIRVNVEGAKRTTQDSLSKRFNDLDDSIDLINGDISTINETFRSAAGSSYNDIQSRFNADEDAIDELDGRLDPIEAQMKKALADRNYTGASALDNRFKATEDKLTAAKTSDYFPGQEFTLDGRFENIEKEIVTARTSNAYGSTSNNPVVYTSLDRRFEAIEEEIKAGRGGNNNLITHFNELNDDKVNYTDIVNGLNYSGEAQKKALDAKQGKALNERINSVVSAYESADTGLSSRITTLETNVNSAKITNGAQTLGKRFYDIDGGSKPDRNLPSIITEIEGAHTSGVIKTSGGQDTPYDDLDERFSAIENYAVWTRTKLTNAFSSHTNAVDGEDTVYTDLDERLETIEGVNKTQDATLGTGFDTGNNTVAKKIAAAESAAKTYAETYADNKFGTGVGTGTNQTNGTVTAQMNAVRGRITSLEEEVSDAHVDNATTLDARFDAIDGGEKATKNIPQLISDIAEKVAKTDIKKTLEYDTNDNTVLQARQGKILKDTIGGTYSTSNTVANAIDALDTRLDKVDGGSALIGTTLATRVSNAESAIDTLNGNANTSGSVLNTVNSRIAEVVNNAPEAFDTLKEIADWIGENSDDALTMQTNISNNASAISGLDTRLTAIDNNTDGRMKVAEDNINAIEGKLGSGFDSTTGNTVAEKIAAVQSTAAADAATKADTAEQNAKAYADTKASAAEQNSKDYTDSGLAGKASVQSVTDLDDRLDSIDGGSKLSTAKGTLGARVTVLEGKDTIVVDYDGEHSNYTESNGKRIPNYNSPTANADYLIADDDEKYYYWRYINNKWELISSAGGGGSGNTSGFIYTASQYNDLKTNHAEQLIENADYYVLQSDVQYEGENSRSIQAYHHYRYVKNNEDVLQEIEIGEPTSRAKTYTIEREDDTTTGNAYLNLYEFDYGIDNSAISDNPRIYLRAHIELPKGGGESSASSLKLVRLNDETRQVRIGKKIYLYAYFSAIADDQTENGKYVLKYNGITIDSGDLVSGKATDDPNNWVVIEDPKFTEGQNPTPIIASPDSTKLYIIQQHTNEGDVYTQWTYTDGTWSSTEGYPNGFIAFDVTNRCKTGDNTLTLTATAVDRNRSRSWNINIVDLRLESNAPDTLLINVNDPYSFSYIPYGAIQKSLKIRIGNNEPIIKPLGTSSGLENFYELTGLTHGAHIIRMQLTAIINGKSEDSDEIIRQYIWYNPEDSSSNVILASRYNNQTETIEQYSNIEIPYQVYKKGASSILVYYYLDDAETPFGSVKLTETNSGILSYVATTDGNHKLTIKVDDQEINVNLVVTRATKQIAPVTGAIIDFDPAAYSNDAIERLPQWKVGQNTYKFTDSSNFNWSNNPNGGGYKEDEDGKCFVIKAGSYVDLNYNLFRTESEPTRANVFKRGAEMKIIFKVKSVRNTKAVWLTNTGEYQNKNVGLTLKAHYGELRTDKAVGNEEALDSIAADEDDNPDTVTIKGITYNYWKPDTSYAVGAIVVIRDVIYKCIDAENTSFSIDLQDKEIDLDDDEPKDYLKKWLKLGQLNTEVISTDSYLYFPYSENDKIELDININSSDSANQFIMSYEDGVPSKAYAYTASDHLQHNNNIHIGSPDCDVYIYKLRIYDRALSTANILQNFIADGKTVEEKVKRHDRNCIYWNSNEKKYYIQKTGEAKLDPIKLAELMPDVKILMLDVPRFTTGKKDFIRDTTLRCIQADGGQVYPSRGDADNWFFDNGFHAGQGTTSDNYGQSARNVDFLFEVDGTHWPTKSKNMTGFTDPPNYKSRVWIGENASKYIVTDEDPAGHWVPTSKYDENIEDWVIDDEVVSDEEEINPTAPSVCRDWMGDDCKISLTGTSIPNNYFNLKENVASSENVNNALFQKRYNDFLPYTSPAKQRDARIKNGMEFVPAVLFIRERGIDINGNPVTRVEFNDDQWHFYGLGNLGDSKKTDYTRAYDPTDMYEFTCENSDNNTNNGQFQSGVFMYNNIRAIETSYAAWNEDTKYGENAIVIRDGKIYQYAGEEMSQAHAWDNSEWNDITPVGNETHYYAPRTNPDTMSYVYPITPEEWNITLNNNYVNRKHYTLVNEAFDGDHSFEFRYACCGDFRDGDRINDTHGGIGTYKVDKKGKQVEITVDDVQEELNHDVICALYEWLVTSTEDQYKNEASQWIIKPAMEFFYAFTHYYTMMDNRAKNTFWHFARTGEHRKVTRPVKELLHVYEESDNAVKNVETGVYTGTFTKTTLTTLPETYYVQGYLPVTDKHFKDGVTYYKRDINTNTYTVTTSVNYTDTDGAPLTMTIKPNYEIPETAEALYTLGFIQTEESEFLPNVQYYTYTNNIYTPMTDVPVGDPIKYLYTQYAFDLWVYDTDTALGIDNNGALVFPYGKEDDDYRVKNEPSSGWAFNGAGSIFWRRLKNTFIDEIADIMNNTQECFNSENLINEFDSFQNCFPEEIWRLDIERKYIRTFTGITNELPYDNAVSEGKQNARFLMSMMQGRKKYQRRQWIRNQGVYFNSKYLLKDIKDNSNTTEFNIITPTGDVNDLAVRPTYNLQLTPYQDMYLNVTIGNGGPTPSIRAEAGKTYTIDLLPYSAGTFAETRLYIYGFKSIAGLGNLAPMYPYSFTLNGLEHLKELDLGTNVSGYRNFNLTTLPFTSNTQLPLLEKLNIRNCNNLAGGIDLSTADNLLEVKADGTLISSLDLPRYTHIESLDLPYTVQNLDLYSAHFLKHLKIYNASGVESYANLYTLNVYDSDYSADWAAEKDYEINDTVLIDNDFYRCTTQHKSVSAAVRDNQSEWATYLSTNWERTNQNISIPVDWMSIASAMIAKNSLTTNLSLEKLHSAFIQHIQTLTDFDDLRDKILDEGEGQIELGGTIHVLGDWSTIEKNEYETTWSAHDLTLDVNQGREQIKHKVTFRYDDYVDDEGNTIHGDDILTLYIKHGDPIPDIWEYDDNGTKVHMLDEMPHRDPTAHSVYQFGKRQYSEYVPYSGWKYAGEDEPIEGTPIANSENIVIETWFKVDPHKYPVKWYLWRNKSDSQSLVKISNIEVGYGGGYELEAPTITEIHNANAEIGKPNFDTYEVTINGGTVSYKIFDGWEKLPTNIAPSKNDASYNIYANWHEGSIAISDLYTENDHLSDEERLLVLSAIDRTTENKYNPNIANNIAVSSRVNFTLGQDIDRTGAVTLVSPNAVFRTDKASGDRIQTSIQPFRAENNAFTIAIDYCFKENMLYNAAKNNAILASCYYQNNTTDEVSGFALYYNLNNINGVPIGPRVGFGDMFNRSEQSIAVGRPINSITTYDGLPQGVESREALTTAAPLGATRNIIVLRHEQDSEILYVYSGFGTENGIPSEVSVQQLSWDNVINDAYINFGQLTASSAEDYEGVKNSSTKAHGTIYWAKYWPEDLGAGECRRIASWPHETMTYAISVLSDSRTGDYRITSASPSIYFTSLETSAHGKVLPYAANTNNYDTRGWGTSDMRTMCNNRLFVGLPTRLQSILCKTRVDYKTASPVTSSNGIDQYTLSANTSLARDYVYMNTIVNIQPSSTELNVYSAEESISSAKPFAWLGDAASINIYSYKTGGGWNDITNSSAETNKVPYYNLRFPYQPIKWTSIEGNKMRIFKETSVSFPSNTTAYDRINAITGGIKVGDILMLPNRSGDISDMAYIYVSDADIRDYGAQVMPNLDVFACESGGWVPSSDYWTRSMGTGNYNSSFCYVDNKGSVSKTGTGVSSYGLGLNYSFSM